MPEPLTQLRIFHQSPKRTLELLLLLDFRNLQIEKPTILLVLDQFTGASRTIKSQTSAAGRHRFEQHIGESFVARTEYE